jgi:hypothetical protein
VARDCVAKQQPCLDTCLHEVVEFVMGASADEPDGLKFPASGTRARLPAPRPGQPADMLNASACDRWGWALLQPRYRTLT